MRTIAIIGASADRTKFGNKAVRAYATAGYKVYPINPRATTIEELPAYRSVVDVPAEKLDRVSIYLPIGAALAVLSDVAAKRPNEVWFNPGADAPEVLDRARALGLNVIAGCSIVDLGISPEDLPE